MNASPWTPRITRLAVISGLALSSLLSCEPSNKVKAGPPQLVIFAPVGPNGVALPLIDPDGGAPLTVSPLSRIVAVFDRILDPTYLEDIADGGATSGKAGVATFQSSVGTAPEASVTYSPNGDKHIILNFFFGNQEGPSILVSAVPTLPSGATVTVTLSKDKVKSKAGEAFVVGTDETGAPLTKETLSFTTDPLAVSLAPEPAVDDAGVALPCGDLTAAMNVVSLSFNNVVNEAMLTHITVTGKNAAGADIAGLASAAEIAIDAGDPTKVNVAPLADTKWPEGATLTVTVDAQTRDPAGGAPLGKPSSACFVVGGSS